MYKRQEEDTEDPFVQGMEKVYKHLMTTLEEIEVKPIEAVGKEFDPNFHNAVMHVDDENFGENIVAEEFQKGYTYRDSIVRPVSYTHLVMLYDEKTAAEFAKRMMEKGVYVVAFSYPVVPKGKARIRTQVCACLLYTSYYRKYL